MDLGKRLKLLRKELNLTRDEVARKINISYSAISKYETNVRFPDQEILKKIADFFNVSVDYLLGRSDVKNPEENKEITKSLPHIDLEGLPDEAVKQVE